MRRINITTNDNKRITKSFADKKEFIEYLESEFYYYVLAIEIANKVWNSNVAEKINYFWHTFSIQSKRRTGDKIINNTLLKDQLAMGGK